MKIIKKLLFILKKKIIINNNILKKGKNMNCQMKKIMKKIIIIQKIEKLKKEGNISKIPYSFIYHGYKILNVFLF